MSKKLSQTERIKRHLLRKGIDYPADKVVAELQATGCETSAQMVYNVRSTMKQAAAVNGEPVKPIIGVTPKAQNALPLGTHIIEVLQDNFAAKKGYLSVAEIMVLVQKRGFKSNAQNFLHSVRMECYRQLRHKKISEYRSGDNVLYGPVETPTAIVPPSEKSVEPPIVETALGIDGANLNDLLAVQRLMRQIGGSDRLKQHVKLLEELETKPAASVLEVLASKVTSPVGVS